MRTLIIVSVIFTVLCLTMLLNYRYINETADELVRLTESLSLDDSSCFQTVEKIEKKWEKSSYIFSLTVSFKDIDYLGETLLALKSAAQNKDEVEFERYKTLLMDAIDGVRRLEKFSIINIL